MRPIIWDYREGLTETFGIIPKMWYEPRKLCAVVERCGACPAHFQDGSLSRRTLPLARYLLVADELLIFTYLEEERHIPYLEIIYRETGDVVTVIEVLSPANKSGEGRKQYIAKQNDLLQTHANLVEIDLLSSGQSTTLDRELAYFCDHPHLHPATATF